MLSILKSDRISVLVGSNKHTKFAVAKEHVLDNRIYQILFLCMLLLVVRTLKLLNQFNQDNQSI